MNGLISVSVLALHPVLLAVILVAALGILLGLGIAVASYFLAVKEDPKAAELVEILPGANCGACGFSGCAGYAAALASGKEVNCGLCAPGGAKVAKLVAACMGTAAGSVKPECAQVLCQGNCNNMNKAFDYAGIQTCAAMSLVSHGPGACDFGCLGLGDCAAACPFDAIRVIDNLAVIRSDMCKGCKKCVSVCPQKIIKMFPREEKKATVYCNNQDKGPTARKACKTACIACGACVRSCPQKAIEIVDNHAVIDITKCTGCMTCVNKCPTSAILPQLIPAAAEE
ncbi:RnfABCDGE type electron transport complex subunit B [Mageeibacillus indolicus]|jgi:hypothetical protein|uniref:Ion-translocating oxidoreductase complex subunit B n=2 Tax=Mageeibacillus indolicus TaxID=884684 RepID=D3QZA5_MAGIU|nr:RnfABCDGE type electron transport complex subunit B [Mageeibacillus indolicus]ADC90958.1 electron transport complex, RnfABCDGE type, B subunit [Mageeibacillus indolicus UPII9-5]PNH18312.1 hypothetical protein B7R76_05570 [Mageeibacillus indolicus]